ncbi:MAG: FkbM family methyltransferase, partial [Gammaproteobacteria bacterium]|nr:FkbM family methyltransferase [Gammaproteobacteria bacterium]
MENKRYDFRMLWSSNAIWAPTGYGVQAKHILPRLQALGITCAQFAWYGLQGAGMTVDTGSGPLQIYPGSSDPFGNDMIAAYALDFKADLVMTLVDVWVMHEDLREHLGVPWMPWFPVDCSPIPQRVLSRVKTADFPTTYSKFGTEEARKAGVFCDYIPHGVDCDLFKPGDRADARKRFGVEDDETFILAMIGANKGIPCRKGYPEAAWIFKQFHDMHPNSILYLHCCQDGTKGGADLPTIFESIDDFPRDAVRFVDQVAYRRGLPDEYMVAIYNAADVLLQPSYNEGFGIPLIEAQACGCPVVVNDCTSMSELVGAGKAVPPLQPAWYPVGGWAQTPDIESFVGALDYVRSRTNEGYREQARDFALQYDWDLLVEKYWVPVLDKVQRLLDKSSGHEHEWLPTGLFDAKGDMSVPCKVQECPAELVIKPSGTRYVKRTGFAMRINGVDLDIEDDPDGGVAKVICREAGRDYKLSEIPFEPGDVVIDVGAQVGVISCYLAKAHPEITIHAYEPVWANYERLCRNIEANGVAGRVLAHNFAVTGDGRDVAIWGDTATNSGGGSVYIKSSKTLTLAESTTLAEIVRVTGADRIKLLKIDCEGSEYEILLASAEP